MAESDYLVYVITAFVGFCLWAVLNGLRNRRIRGGPRPAPNFRIPHYTPAERRQFLISIPFGVILGILVYLPHLNAMVGGEPLWFLPFIQVNLVIFYATIVVTFAIFKFVAAFTTINFFIDRQGYADGIISSFVIVQVIVFIKYPLIFFPQLNS